MSSNNVTTDDAHKSERVDFQLQSTLHIAVPGVGRFEIHIKRNIDRKNFGLGVMGPSGEETQTYVIEGFVRRMVGYGAPDNDIFVAVQCYLHSNYDPATPLKRRGNIRPIGNTNPTLPAPAPINTRLPEPPMPPLPEGEEGDELGDFVKEAQQNHGPSIPITRNAQGRAVPAPGWESIPLRQPRVPSRPIAEPTDPDLHADNRRNAALADVPDESPVSEGNKQYEGSPITTGDHKENRFD